MRVRLVLFAFLALAVLGVGVTGSVAAPPNVEYVFRGELLAAPPPGSPSLLIDVGGGNHRAVRLMIGQSSGQSFAVDSNTEYLRWSHGVPTVVQQSNLAVGDALTIRIRAPRILQQVESAPAKIVADRGPNPGRPGKPLWLFKGSLNSPADGSHLSVHVGDGNHRALKAMPRPGPRPVLRLWPADDLHPLAGPGARAASRRASFRSAMTSAFASGPRPVVASAGRIDSGEPRRRARAALFLLGSAHMAVRRPASHAGLLAAICP